jgi:DnaK suppressor protein
MDLSNKPADLPTVEELLAMPEEEYMNERQLAFFRWLLLEEKRKLMENAAQTTANLAEENVATPDWTDRATIEEEQALELRVRDRERKLMKKIDEALKRIDEGTYGYCEETGEPIGLKRLLARPTATLSIEAQERHERMEKLRAS